MVSGKQIWTSLDIDVLSGTKLPLTDEARKHQRIRRARRAIKGGPCTKGDLLAVDRERVAARVELNPKSRQRMAEHCAHIVKTWPGRHIADELGAVPRPSKAAA